MTLRTVGSLKWLLGPVRCCIKKPAVAVGSQYSCRALHRRTAAMKPAPYDRDPSIVLKFPVMVASSED
jgi:hypothetical protein